MMPLVLNKWLVGWLSGGFTPCRHLRPSSAYEHFLTGVLYPGGLLLESNIQGGFLVIIVG